VVARLAGRHEIVPRVAATPVAWHDVIESEVRRLPAAVLAGVAIAVEDLAARELHPRSRPPDQVLEPDDGRGVELRRGCPDDLVVVLEDLGAFAEHEPKGARQVADVQRLVVLIQDQDHTLHGRIVSEDGEAPPALMKAGSRHAVTRRP